MPTAAELLQQLPKEYSRDQAQTWIDTVLALTDLKDVPIDVPREFREKKVQLPEIEAAVYREILATYGEPTHVLKEGQSTKTPNVTLLFVWALGEKYRLGLRYRTHVTPTGIFKYDLR